MCFLYLTGNFSENFESRTFHLFTTGHLASNLDDKAIENPTSKANSLLRVSKNKISKKTVAPNKVVEINEFIWNGTKNPYKDENLLKSSCESNTRNLFVPTEKSLSNLNSFTDQHKSQCFSRVILETKETSPTDLNHMKKNTDQALKDVKSPVRQIEMNKVFNQGEKRSPEYQPSELRSKDQKTFNVAKKRTESIDDQTEFKNGIHIDKYHHVIDIPVTNDTPKNMKDPKNSKKYTQDPNNPIINIKVNESKNRNPSQPHQSSLNVSEQYNENNRHVELERKSRFQNKTHSSPISEKIVKKNEHSNSIQAISGYIDQGKTSYLQETKKPNNTKIDNFVWSRFLRRNEARNHDGPRDRIFNLDPDNLYSKIKDSEKFISPQRLMADEAEIQKREVFHSGKRRPVFNWKGSCSNGIQGEPVLPTSNILKTSDRITIRSSNPFQTKDDADNGWECSGITFGAGLGVKSCRNKKQYYF